MIPSGYLPLLSVLAATALAASLPAPGGFLGPASLSRSPQSLAVTATGGVIATFFRVLDNGDQDGFADTNETVGVAFTLLNRTETDLTGVEARIITSNPKIDCADQVASVGNVAANANSGPVSFRSKVDALANTGSASDGPGPVGSLRLGRAEVRPLRVPRARRAGPLRLHVDQHHGPGDRRGRFMYNPAPDLDNCPYQAGLKDRWRVSTHSGDVPLVAGSHGVHGFGSTAFEPRFGGELCTRPISTLPKPADPNARWLTFTS